MLKKLAQISTKLDYDKLSCVDLVRCIFSLNDTDILILKSIPEYEGRNIKDITKIIKKDRSTIHRSLEKLVSCNICYKERRSGENRGFIDYYYTIPEKELLRKAEKNLDDCYLKIKKMLRELEDQEKAEKSND
jgi:predicted transcriptional regulator